jgi:hypothetical protein
MRLLDLRIQRSRSCVSCGLEFSEGIRHIGYLGFLLDQP